MTKIYLSYFNTTLVSVRLAEIYKEQASRSYFNTTLVSVRLFYLLINEILLIDFNTTLVSVRQMQMKFLRIWLKISIQHLFRFDIDNTAKPDKKTYISIQHLFRFDPKKL